MRTVHILILSGLTVISTSALPDSFAQSNMGSTFENTSPSRRVSSKRQTSVAANSIHGIQISFIPSIDNSYSSIEVVYRGGADPYRWNKLQWGGGLRFSRVTDARADKDYGVALCVFVTRRLLNGTRLFLLPKVGFDVDYAWRKDDEDRFVNTLLFSVYPALTLEVVGSKRTVFVVGSGYRFATSSDWQRPGEWVDAEWVDESETTPGVWRKEQPTINMSGFFLSVGLEFLLR